MDTEDFIGLPDCNDPETAIQDEELHNASHEPQGDDSQPSCSDTGTSRENGGYLVNVEGDSEKEDGQIVVEEDPDKDSINNKYISQDQVLSETVVVAETMNHMSSEVPSENGCLTSQDKNPASNHKREGNCILINALTSETIFFCAAAAVFPLICIFPNPACSCNRDSKKKLEELLQQWSEWHALHGSTSKRLSWLDLGLTDPDEVLESGEQTFFPALRVGLEKFSAVSFWMDNGTGKPESKEIIQLDGDSVPLYDRGYAFGLGSVDGSNLEGGLEILDASRCFNCNSYNHTLRDCPKPRDNVAVNNARKQHKSKRNQATGSRNPIRYYQNTPGGKYDGLRPGALDADTRKLLGLGEFDPPPWLNRMREIGYPPGYLDALVIAFQYIEISEYEEDFNHLDYNHLFDQLMRLYIVSLFEHISDPEDEDQPSGIMIYGDEESKIEQEDGEIVSDSAEPTPVPEPRKKMSIEFPGINAPIPENADKRLWAEVVSSSDLSRSRSHRRFKPSSESSRTHFREQKWSMNHRDDGPPGVDPGVSPSSFLPRYDSYDSQYSFHSPRDYDPVSRTTYSRSFSERGRRSPLVHEDFPSHGSYSSRSYSSGRKHSPRSHGSAGLGTSLDDRRIDRDSDYTSQRDHRDYYHHRIKGRVAVESCRWLGAIH
ncbi:PSP, proline-rich [Dillenia turbinata]|uniref:PSP, proline-rich n=1 Tax=Dillenia turbinata TaxID=194707 RepID=A0AAN8V747_9MAGN